MDADDLYGLAPEEFTAARTAAARAARADGDKAGAVALAALRRPSVAAWLVNLVARRRLDLLEQVLELGPALAQAQAAGQGEQLRALGEQRRALVEAVADAAVELAGRPVTRDVREEVAGTFEAALADPASATAVRSGRLVRALSYAGFGGVDLADAVAQAPAAPRREPAPRVGGGAPGPGARDRDRRRQQLAAAEQASLVASGRLDDAVRACQRVEGQARDAVEAVARAENAVDEARRALDQADVVRAEAVATRDAAERRGAAALEAVGSAQEVAEQAREVVDGLRRSGS